VQSSQDMKLTAYLHLMPRLRMSEAIPLHPHTPLWHAEGQLYLYLVHNWNFTSVWQFVALQELCYKLKYRMCM